MVYQSDVLKGLSHAPLLDSQGQQIEAGSLWADQPVLVVVLRRPGCILCRAEAQKVWRMRAEIEKQGVKLVCVVKEWIKREIAAFSPEFWGGLVYHDTSMAFYKAVNGGESVLRGSMAGMLNPFSSAWKRINAAKKEVSSHNLVGEGLIMGGLMVVGKGGTGPYLVHLETDLGVHAETDEVLAAVQRAAAASAAQAPAVAAVQEPVALQAH